MGYTTHHPISDYLLGACLGVHHDFMLRCQYKTRNNIAQYVKETAEIDLCAHVAKYFGTSARMSAQGKGTNDILVDSPTMRIEVKYFRPGPGQGWPALNGDWQWLLSAKNAGNEFNKRAWVVFWPGKDLFKLADCISVTKSQENYSLADFAPFTPYIKIEKRKNGAPRLEFSDEQPKRVSIIKLPPQGKGNDKKIRVDVIGNMVDPIWCAVYTRIRPTDPLLLSIHEVAQFSISNDEIFV